MSSLPEMPPPADRSMQAYKLAGDLAAFPWGDLLAPWSPPLPPNGEVILVSLFADVFVRDRDGSVYWLNTHHNRVDKIAPSQQAFEQRLEKEYVAMLKTPLVDMLRTAGRELPSGRLYGLLKPLSDGGRWAIDNVGTAHVAEAMAFHASRFVPPPSAAPQAGKPAAAPEKKKKGWFN